MDFWNLSEQEQVEKELSKLTHVHLGTKPSEFLRDILKSLDEETVQSLLTEGFSITLHDEQSSKQGYRVAEFPGEDKNQKKGNVIISTFVQKVLIDTTLNFFAKMDKEKADLTKAVEDACESLKTRYPDVTGERLYHEGRMVIQEWDEAKKQRDQENAKQFPEGRAELDRAQVELEALELAELQNNPISRIKTTASTVISDVVAKIKGTTKDKER
ncbi:MAG: hypothetical protein FWE16_04890 [Firmicutes bacterium]|nr:hypothetical protein [Bacillota bacterium]